MRIIRINPQLYLGVVRKSLEHAVLIHLPFLQASMGEAWMRSKFKPLLR